MLQEPAIFFPFEKINSVLPPPISKVIILRFVCGIFQNTPSRVSRASSSHEIIFISISVSFFTKRTNSCPFDASRTALVATAKRDGFPFSMQICLNSLSTFKVVSILSSMSLPWLSILSPKRVIFRLETISLKS